MAQESEQLIARIAEQVIAELNRQGVTADDGQADGAPAAIRPPAGVCTGDYSKFVELQGRMTAAAEKTSAGGAPEASRDDEATASAAAARPVLGGIVTARQLEGAGPVVNLTPDAKLTPLAVDYVKEKKLTLCRVDAQAAGGSASGGAAGQRGGKPGEWLWWIDGQCEAVDQLTVQLRDRLKPVGPRHQLSSLGAAVRDMARGVRQGRAAGGVLFVHSAAQAACFANRCPSLRGVVGTCGEAVEEGIALLGANVLIVEYPHVGPRAMRAMVERFTTAGRPGLAAVDRQLEELGRCV